MSILLNSSSDQLLACIVKIMLDCGPRRPCLHGGHASGSPCGTKSWNPEDSAGNLESRRGPGGRLQSFPRALADASLSISLRDLHLKVPFKPRLLSACERGALGSLGECCHAWSATARNFGTIMSGTRMKQQCQSIKDLG